MIVATRLTFRGSTNNLPRPIKAKFAAGKSNGPTLGSPAQRLLIRWEVKVADYLGFLYQQSTVVTLEPLSLLSDTR